MLYVVQNGEEVNAQEGAAEELGRQGHRCRDLRGDAEGADALLPRDADPSGDLSGAARPSIEKLGADWIKPGNLVSNGAYTLAEFVPNDHIKLVKNPKFYDAANVKIDIVNYIPTEDRSTAMKRFEAGELDSNDDIPTEQLADLKAKFGDQVRVGPYLGTYYYVFKTDKEPWYECQAAPRHLHGDRPRLPGREGLAEHHDPGLFHRAARHRGLRDRAAADYAEMSQLDREDEAKKILTELGYGPDKPLKMEIRYNTSENHKNTAVAIQEQLKPLGVEVTLLNTDTKTHYGYPRAARAISTSRAPAGSPTTRTRKPSSASRARPAAATTTPATPTTNSRT